MSRRAQTFDWYCISKIHLGQIYVDTCINTPVDLYRLLSISMKHYVYRLPGLEKVGRAYVKSLLLFHNGAPGLGGIDRCSGPTMTRDLDMKPG